MCFYLAVNIYVLNNGYIYFARHGDNCKLAKYIAKFIKQDKYTLKYCICFIIKSETCVEKKRRKHVLTCSAGIVL